MLTSKKQMLPRQKKISFQSDFNDYDLFFALAEDTGQVLNEWKEKNGFFIAGQIIICLLTAIFVYRKEFLLSALVVLLIGFSTCLAVFSS